MNRKLGDLLTERKNEKSEHIDRLDSLGIAALMNQEDLTVAHKVREELPAIAALIDLAAKAIEKTGRVIYAGAGTSGRLGILDASEIPPTFDAPPDWFIGVIAGGDPAIRSSVEGAEDEEEGGRRDIRRLNVGPNDLVIGIAASGRTPYVGGVLREARNRGAGTALISCNKLSALAPLADVAVEIEVGPEIIMGSTRLKSGTAQKMVLNMISTGAMIRLNKVFGNLMVDMQTKNEKLRDRAVRMIMEASCAGPAEAQAAYDQSGGRMKVAIAALLTGCGMEEAEKRLAEAKGSLRAVVEQTAE